MGFTALVTDSCACISPEQARQYNVRVVPLYVKMGDETYRDGVDISAEAFYQRLPQCTPLPTTSQPSVGDFTTAYRELIAQGATGIISVHLSAGVSGTINSATLAAQEIHDVPIEIVDTACIAAIQVLAVEAGARALKLGRSFDEAVAAIRQVVALQKTVFTLDTLEYLYKGGRIGGAAALVGSLLQFKPMLHFKEGKIDVLERVRKSSRSSPRMVELLRDWFGQDPLRIIVMHATCADRAQALVELVRQNLNVVGDIPITVLTPVVGTHGGPGTLGLCACPASAFPGEAS